MIANNKTKGKYSITYYNGITQVKDLITQDDFENVIQPKQKEIFEYMLVDDKMAANAIKRELFDLFGDNYFTDGSPLYGAFKTGKLILPKHQGGTTKCKVVKLNN
jgi:hypothetical protein